MLLNTINRFWEFALGTDPENANDTPDFADPLTFQSTLGGGTADLSISNLNTSLSRMNAAGRLTSVRGIGDFNATVGL